MAKKWKAIKTHLNLEKTRSSIDQITIGPETLTSKPQIAEAFKHYFETCAQKLAENLPPSQNTVLAMPHATPWSFKHISESDLL